jgi:hypothetical protein
MNWKGLDFNFFEAGSCYAAQGGLELTILARFSLWVLGLQARATHMARLVCFWFFCAFLNVHATPMLVRSLWIPHSCLATRMHLHVLLPHLWFGDVSLHPLGYRLTSLGLWRFPQKWQYLGGGQKALWWYMRSSCGTMELNNSSLSQAFSKQ